MCSLMQHGVRCCLAGFSSPGCGLSNIVLCQGWTTLNSGVSGGNLAQLRIHRLDLLVIADLH